MEDTEERIRESTARDDAGIGWIGGDHDSYRNSKFRAEHFTLPNELGQGLPEGQCHF